MKRGLLIIVLCLGSAPQVFAVVSVSNTLLTPATKGVNYDSGDGTASGASVLNIDTGVAPFTCGIIAGSLPAGMTLSEITPNYTPLGSCLLSGTPTTGGDYTFTVQATDATSSTANKSITFIVADNSLAPVISSPVATATSTTIETFTWTTNIAGNSYAFYMSPGPYPARTNCAAADATGVTSHSLACTVGIEPNANYGWGVRSCAIIGGVPVDYACGFYILGSFNAGSPASSGTYDFYLNAQGPHNILQGYPAYVLISSDSIAGTAALVSVKYVISGTPANTLIRWPDQQDNGLGQCSISTVTLTNDTLTCSDVYHVNFEVVTNSGGTTPLGSSTITITVTATTTGSPVTHTKTWALNVNASSFSAGSPSSYPAIPVKALWESQMSTYGDKWAGRACGAGEQTVWYYDGQATYYKISDYTQDFRHIYGSLAPTPPNNGGFCLTTVTPGQYNWLDAAIQSQRAYESYTAPSFGVPGYRQFPHGLYQAWIRNGDATAKTELHNLAVNTSAPHTGGISPDADAINIRETCYSLGTRRLDFDLGGGSTLTQINQLVANCVGAIDQIVNQTTDFAQPFMMALCAQALIEYYNDPLTGNHNDVRIPDALKKLADYMWANDWQPWAGTNGAFIYNETQTLLKNPADNQGLANLNTLICPLWGWLWKVTGLDLYRLQGDTIWYSGVNANPANGISFSGKNFSQQYRWSFDYVTYRSAPANFYGVSTRSTMIAKARE